MTLKQVMREVDSRELTTWMAYDRYFEPIGNSWQQTGTIAAAVLAPHCPRGKTPEPTDFVPLASKQAPQHKTQIDATLRELAKVLGANKDG